METLFNKLKQAVEIQETKTHNTLLAWVGDDIDFVRVLVGADISTPLQDDTYLIMVGDNVDNYVLFSEEELTEDLVNEIKSELGI